MVVKLKEVRSYVESSLRVVLSHMVVKPLLILFHHLACLRVVLSHMVVKQLSRGGISGMV